MTRRIKTPYLFRTLAFFGVCTAAGVGLLQSQTPNSEDGWRPIFNGKNFEGWYTFLPSVGKNSDPNKVFKIEDGMIHVLDMQDSNTPDTVGYLATDKDYSHVRVRLDYKFGTKRYGNRAEARRDAGLLYYFFGPDFVWGNNAELQIQEQDTGDLWINGGVSVTSPVIAQGVPIWGSTGGNFSFTVQSKYSKGRRPGQGPGMRQSQTTPDVRRILKSGDFENREGWNTVEAVLDGDRVTHLVNGRVVFTGNKIMRQSEDDPTKWTPLTSGKLLLEAEGAEVWYRNVSVKDIPLN